MNAISMSVYFIVEVLNENTIYNSLEEPVAIDSIVIFYSNNQSFRKTWYYILKRIKNNEDLEYSIELSKKFKYQPFRIKGKKIFVNGIILLCDDSMFRACYNLYLQSNSEYINILTEDMLLKITSGHIVTYEEFLKKHERHNAPELVVSDTEILITENQKTALIDEDNFHIVSEEQTVKEKTGERALKALLGSRNSEELPPIILEKRRNTSLYSKDPFELIKLFCQHYSAKYTRESENIVKIELNSGKLLKCYILDRILNYVQACDLINMIKDSVDFLLVTNETFRKRINLWAHQWRAPIRVIGFNDLKELFTSATD